jgi:hypothetical protein
MTDFAVGPSFEIGRRIDIRGPYSWFVVLKPAQDAEIALQNFMADLSAVLDVPVRVVRPTGAIIESLRAALGEPTDDAAVLTGLDQADEGTWGALDINRSGFARPGAVILWLSPAGLVGLCQHAPNLRSFVGGSIFYLGSHGETMTAAERQQRISDLEMHFKITSAEVVRLAESRALPPEPHFVEWLVLLDRGDLV